VLGSSISIATEDTWKQTTTANQIRTMIGIGNDYLTSLFLKKNEKKYKLIKMNKRDYNFSLTQKLQSSKNIRTIFHEKKQY
jgi:hypothetical protein